MQGKKIRPTLSFGFAETGYIHPINSWPRATLRLLKTNQKLHSQCSGKPLLTKCHEVYKRKMSWKNVCFPSQDSGHQMPSPPFQLGLAPELAVCVPCQAGSGQSRGPCPCEPPSPVLGRNPPLPWGLRGLFSVNSPGAGVGRGRTSPPPAPSVLSHSFSHGLSFLLSYCCKIRFQIL